jgi:hypothetical protein
MTSQVLIRRLGLRPPSACCAADSTRLVSTVRGPLLWSRNFLDNAALCEVKLNIFRVEDGKPIMHPKKHPVFEALHRMHAGDSLFPNALVLCETEAEHESALDQCGLPEQKECLDLPCNLFHCFHCAVTLNDMLPVGGPVQPISSTSCTTRPSTALSQTPMARSP